MNENDYVITMKTSQLFILITTLKSNTSYVKHPIYLINMF